MNFLRNEGPTKEITAKLAKLGWRMGGKGYFSQVYINPKKNYVLKLNTHSDKGFTQYVNLLKTHPNKHFPVISAMKTIDLGSAWESRPVSLYLIEKLYQADYTDYCNYRETFTRIMLSYKDPLDWLIENYKESFCPISIDMLRKDPSLEEALRIIGANKKKRGRWIDNAETKGRCRTWRETG